MSSGWTGRARRGGHRHLRRLPASALGLLLLAAWVNAPLCALACIDTQPPHASAVAGTHDAADADRPCHGPASQPAPGTGAEDDREDHAARCDCDSPASVASRADSAPNATAAMAHVAADGLRLAPAAAAPELLATFAVDLPPPRIILLHSTLLI